MVGSKAKVIKQKEKPNNFKKINKYNNPDKYYSYKPSWNFKSCDKNNWSLFEEHVKSCFFEKIMPTLQSLETQTWQDILIKAKKHHHSINIKDLNKKAITRLEQLMIEAESLISLKIQGKWRLYGYMSCSVFNLLWVDYNHGDNVTCVCRSKKKHT